MKGFFFLPQSEVIPSHREQALAQFKVCTLYRLRCIIAMFLFNFCFRDLLFFSFFRKANRREESGQNAELHCLIIKFYDYMSGMLLMLYMFFRPEWNFHGKLKNKNMFGKQQLTSSWYKMVLAFSSLLVFFFLYLLQRDYGIRVAVRQFWFITSIEMVECQYPVDRGTPVATYTVSSLSFFCFFIFFLILKRNFYNMHLRLPISFGWHIFDIFIILPIFFYFSFSVIFLFVFEKKKYSIK